MIRVHKIELDLNDKQRTYCARGCGVARVAYNWALGEWRRQHEAGEKPNESALRRKLNAIKRGQFPWMAEVTKAAPQQAIKNLGVAYGRAFNNVHKGLRRGRRNQYGFPRFKKKGVHDSFRADNGPETIKVDGKRIRLPIVGWLHMRESVRFQGTIQSVTISRTADRWFAAVSVRVDHEPRESVGPVLGVDLGVKDMAVISDGERISAPKALKANLRRLRRWQRKLARRANGSANRSKAKTKIARLHARIASVRKDALHKATTGLVRRAGTIVLEDLNVSGMMANRRLARAISDVGVHEFRRQIEYKAEMAGVCVVYADRWFPSSKMCSACGSVRDTLPLSIREWTCDDCGTDHDRDQNAAMNLARLATASSAGSKACGADGSVAVTKVTTATSGAETGTRHRAGSTRVGQLWIGSGERKPHPPVWKKQDGSRKATI